MDSVNQRQREQQAWQAFKQELDRWQNKGREATFWWRDDDAIAATEPLHRLLDLSRRFKAPLALAVIPARLEDSLTTIVESHNTCHVLQHGYAHRSHAMPQQKKIEIGGSISQQDLAQQLQKGKQILSRAFKSDFVPVLVPPWNRIDAVHYELLSELGYLGISAMWSRDQAYPAKSLLQVNTHLDPVFWRHDRGMIPLDKALDQLRQHLFCRRSDIVDCNEPTGILTHHLDQTEPVWQFCEALVKLISNHPACRWLNASGIWSRELPAD